MDLGAQTLNWKKFSVVVSADSATTTIEFWNGDPATDNSNLLDAVTLSSR